MRPPGFNHLSRATNTYRAKKNSISFTSTRKLGSSLHTRACDGWSQTTTSELYLQRLASHFEQKCLHRWPQPVHFLEQVALSWKRLNRNDERCCGENRGAPWRYWSLVIVFRPVISNIENIVRTSSSVNSALFWKELINIQKTVKMKYRRFTLTMTCNSVKLRYQKCFWIIWFSVYQCCSQVLKTESWTIHSHCVNLHDKFAECRVLLNRLQSPRSFKSIHQYQWNRL